MLTFPRKLVPSLPKVSVITTIKDRPELTERSLRSLLSRATYHPLELLWVDDGSQEPTKRLLSKLASEIGSNSRLSVRILTNPDEPRGVSHADNLGLFEATGDILVLTDNDVLYAPRWLEVGVTLVQNPDILEMGVKVVSLFNYFHPEPTRVPGLFNCCGVPVFRSEYGTGCNLIFLKDVPRLWGGMFPVGMPDDLHIHNSLYKKYPRAYLISFESYVQHIGVESSLGHDQVARAFHFLGQELENVCPGS